MEKLFKSYVEHFGAPPQNILEIGSRDGHDAETLRTLAGLPPESVYVVEAHPDCVKAIRNTYPRFNLHHLAIFDKVGILDFNAIDYNQPLPYVGTSSLLVRNEAQFDPNSDMYNIVIESNKRWVKVVGITGQMLLQLINQREIDLLKLDVEGVTLEVLQSFGADLRLIKMIHTEGELYEVWKGQHQVNDVVEYMKYMGFEEVYRVQNYYNQVDIIWRRLPIS